MRQGVHTVLLTSHFEADAKVAGVTPSELDEMIVFLSRNPTAGDLMAGTGGARKVRFAKRG
jgi:hypothetical protein